MEREFAQKFKPYLDHPIFLEVLDLVRKNSQGKIWLMGGFLYKNLARELYGKPTEIYIKDLDFLVEYKNDLLQEIRGWQIYTNSYGSQNYMTDTVRTSFTEIRKAIRANKMNNFTVDEFIHRTPLTIQSIVYDIDEEKIVGNIGVNALLNKTIQVNNFEQAELYVHLKNKTIEQWLDEKKAELGF